MGMYGMQVKRWTLGPIRMGLWLLVLLSAPSGYAQPDTRQLTREVLAASGIDSLFRAYTLQLTELTRSGWQAPEPSLPHEYLQAQLLQSMAPDSLLGWAADYAVDNLEPDSLASHLQWLRGPLGHLVSYTLLTPEPQPPTSQGAHWLPEPEWSPYIAAQSLPAPSQSLLLRLDTLSYLSHLGEEAQKDLLRMQLRLQDCARPPAERSSERQRREQVAAQLAGGLEQQLVAYYQDRLFRDVGHLSSPVQQRLLAFWASSRGQYYGFFMHQLIGHVLQQADAAMRRALR